ncbi:MAG: ABC transporter permease [Rubrivivax sp.]
MQAFLALVRKDLQQFLANRRALLLSIVAPIVIAAFFGSVFGSPRAAPSRVAVAVTDLDRSALSQAVVAALAGDPALDVAALDQAAAAAEVRAGKRRAAIVLPPGFGAAAGAALFGAGPRPQVQLLYDPSQAMALALVRGLLAQHTMHQVGQAAMGGAGVSGAAGVSPASASGPAGGAFGLPFETQEVAASGREGDAPYDGYAHSFAGMGVQFILLMGVDMAIGLLLMRRLGLWARLRAAPLSRRVLLGSRIVSCALIAFGIFVVIYAVAMAVFGVRVQGSWIGFVAVLAAFSLLTATFGLLIAALGRTPEATRGLAILATLMLVMLGGAWVPSFIFPQWLQTVSLAVPTRWAIDGLDAMTWRAQPLAAAVAPVAVMLAFSAVFAALAIWRFDWQE